MTLRSISILQPWAGLVALGIKSIETRGWSTPHRGPVAIHASKGRADRCAESDAMDVARAWAGTVTWPQLYETCAVRGAILAVVNLVNVVRAPCLPSDLGLRPERMVAEEEMGNFTPGRWLWVLRDPVRLANPILPCRGARGLWTVPMDVDEMIRAGLARAAMRRGSEAKPE